MKIGINAASTTNQTFVMKSFPNFFNTFCNFSRVAFGPDTKLAKLLILVHRGLSGEKYLGTQGFAR